MGVRMIQHQHLVWYMRTHVTFVLDSSGSMDTIRDDTIGGFNTFLENQYGEPGEATERRPRRRGTRRPASHPLRASRRTESIIGDSHVGTRDTVRNTG
jgi:hypothetical protein